jgi:hypothetical protein
MKNIMQKTAGITALFLSLTIVQGQTSDPASALSEAIHNYAEDKSEIALEAKLTALMSDDAADIQALAALLLSSAKTKTEAAQFTTLVTQAAKAAATTSKRDSATVIDLALKGAADGTRVFTIDIPVITVKAVKASTE